MTSRAATARLIDTDATPPAPRGERASRAALRWATAALVAVTWTSGAIFGAYILAHYGGAIPGALDDWNSELPRLYERATPLANLGIGIHFVGGGILLVLGPLQLIGRVRARWPGLHRWVGRLYAVSALGAGVGGLTFIARKGTVGGAPMTVGFSLYGALVALSAVETWRHARARRLDAHRAWALRLFALAVGSWLYRMDYGFWQLLAHGAGHTRGFGGPFDHFMDFFFYVPNLILVELLLRARPATARPAVRAVASVALASAAAFLVVATYFFTRYAWAPAIFARWS